MLAGLLIVGGGLGGLILFSRYNQRTPAVVVTSPVAHGRPLAREDLAVTDVALDGGVATIGSLSEVVGRHAAHDLEPGEMKALDCLNFVHCKISCPTNDLTWMVEMSTLQGEVNIFRIFYSLLDLFFSNG